jgi:hypothetical protein
VTPTPYERAVVEIIGAHGVSINSESLRKALMARGFGKHPAAVAMNLTRVAWRERFFTCFINNDDVRYFMLTSDGQALPNKDGK